MDDNSTSFGATTMVQKKGGSDTFAVSFTANFVTDLGYPKAILQTDPEPSIIHLAGCAAAQLKPKGVNITVRQAPKGSHSSNGGVERLIGKVDALARTFREHVQVNYHFELPDDHLLMPWIIRHAGWIDARYQVHNDGRTARQRLKNVPYTSLVAFQRDCFGEALRATYRQRQAEVRMGVWSLGWQNHCHRHSHPAYSWRYSLLP